MSSTPEIDLCQIPAGPPPEGVTSNFVNPHSLGPALMAVMGITVGWGIIFTGARLYINIRKLGWSDCKPEFSMTNTSLLDNRYLYLSQHKRMPRASSG